MMTRNEFIQQAAMQFRSANTEDHINVANKSAVYDATELADALEAQGIPFDDSKCSCCGRDKPVEPICDECLYGPGDSIPVAEHSRRAGEALKRVGFVPHETPVDEPQDDLCVTDESQIGGMVCHFCGGRTSTLHTIRPTLQSGADGVYQLCEACNNTRQSICPGEMVVAAHRESAIGRLVRQRRKAAWEMVIQPEGSVDDE